MHRYITCLLYCVNSYSLRACHPTEIKPPLKIEIPPEVENGTYEFDADTNNISVDVGRTFQLRCISESTDANNLTGEVGWYKGKSVRHSTRFKRGRPNTCIEGCILPTWK